MPFTTDRPHKCDGSISRSLLPSPPANSGTDERSQARGSASNPRTEPATLRHLRPATYLTLGTTERGSTVVCRRQSGLTARNRPKRFDRPKGRRRTGRDNARLADLAPAGKDNRLLAARCFALSP